MAQSTRISVQEIIDRTQARIAQLGINSKRDKYRHLILQEAEKHFLDEMQVKELARHIGIVLASPPRFARAWTLSICKVYMSARYTNRNNPNEFVIIISSKSLFGVKAIIHHTPYGYLDKSWFSTFVPELDLYASNYENALKKIPANLQGKEREDFVRNLFTKHVNDNVNPKFPGGMSIEQIHATNAFFLKYLPGVDGICKICYKLSLPRSGPGVRWLAEANSHCEVRMSEAKPQGYSNQQKLYLTHNYRVDQMTLHVKWNGITTDAPTLVKKLQQPDTHIAWENYDYEEIVNRLPASNSNKFMVCQCKKAP